MGTNLNIRCVFGARLTILALGVFADEAAPPESAAVVDDVADKAEVNENLEAEKFGNIHTVINGIDYHQDVDSYGNTYQDHKHLTYDAAHGANHHHGHLTNPNDGGHAHGYDGGYVLANGHTHYGHGHDHAHGYDHGHGHGHGHGYDHGHGHGYGHGHGHGYDHGHGHGYDHGHGHGYVGGHAHGGHHHHYDDGNHIYQGYETDPQTGFYKPPSAYKPDKPYSGQNTGTYKPPAHNPHKHDSGHYAQPDYKPDY